MLNRKFLRLGCMQVWLFLVVVGLGASTLLAAEGTVQKQSSSSDGYCNLKIPALRPSTLAGGSLELKSSQTGDVIDFYGPCNYDPKSQDEVAAQKRFRSRKYQKL